MPKDLAVIKQLEAIAETLPTPVYWVDTDSRLLGANGHALKAIGASSLSEVIGKTPYEFYAQSLAEPIVMHNEEVMEKRLPLSQEETIRDIQTGKIRYYRASKSPLLDDAGKVIGLVGSSTEITEEKESEALKLETLKKAQVLKYLELLAPLFPILVYWNDVDSVVLGANQHTLSGVGANASLKGKSPYDMYPREIAERIVKHNNEVMRTGQILWQEEPIKDMTTGRMRYYSAFKAPLRDEDGKIIGTLGISIETTAEKEADALKLEIERERQQNEMLQLEKKAQQYFTEQQTQFSDTVKKVAHDINSPLSTMSMVLNACEELPEEKRTMLRKSLNSALGVLSSLAMYTKNKTAATSLAPESRQNLLVADYVAGVLGGKKYQYLNHSVEFKLDITESGKTALIDVQSAQLGRSLSNIINNAIDALPEDRHGLIAISVDANDKQVFITIRDNGNGMTFDDTEKIRNRTSFTANKTNGHGLGLQQVWDMLEYNRGKMELDSTLHQGTSFKLSFPRSKSADWLVQEIVVYPDTIVVLLEDDTSLHTGWQLHFNRLLKPDYQLQVHYFVQGKDVLDFIQALSNEERLRVLLLADYELAYQLQNGLQIIIESKITHAVLITGHTSNAEIRKSVLELGINILAKHLLGSIPIRLEKSFKR